MRTTLLILLSLLTAPTLAQRRQDPPLTFPPSLANNAPFVTDSSPDFLKPPATLKPDVTIAKTPPTIDLLYYPNQNYPGQPWSNWGDSLAVAHKDGGKDGEKYYASIGDHLAIGAKGDGEHGTGTAFVFEYDPRTKQFRQLVDVAKVLALPKDHYTPGKIHGRLDLGSDGFLYFATHRGSERSAIDKHHYAGDWILRTDPRTGKTEIVTQCPVPKHSMPNTVLDPQRLIFYAGTAAGPDAKDQGIHFFAYDIKNKKLLHSSPNGPARAMAFAKSTGRLYYVPGNTTGQLMRFDPATNAVTPVKDATLGIRAATEETPQNLIYCVSLGQRATDADLYSLNTKTEEVKKIGTIAVGSQAYVATIDADPTGRYLYYIPGAHGSSDQDGSAVVQYDTKTNQKKVLAFLHPFYKEKYNLTLKGTYSVAVSSAGDKLFVTWNTSRGSKAWDSCSLTVIHIPKSERPD